MKLLMPGWTVGAEILWMTLRRNLLAQDSNTYTSQALIEFAANKRDLDARIVFVACALLTKVTNPIGSGEHKTNAVGFSEQTLSEYSNEWGQS